MLVSSQITKSYDKTKAKFQNLEHMGSVAGINFYEHPTMGDEAPLIASYGELFGLSIFWEVPSLDELLG